MAKVIPSRTRIREAYQKWQDIDGLLEVKTELKDNGFVNTNVNFLDFFIGSDKADQVTEVNKIVAEYKDVSFMLKRKITLLPKGTKYIKVYTYNGKSVRKLNINIQDRIDRITLNIIKVEKELNNPITEAVEQARLDKQISKSLLQELEVLKLEYDRDKEKWIRELELENEVLIELESLKKQGFKTITQGFYTMSVKKIRCLDSDLKPIDKDLSFCGGVFLHDDNIDIIKVQPTVKKTKASFKKAIFYWHLLDKIYISGVE